MKATILTTVLAALLLAAPAPAADERPGRAADERAERAGRRTLEKDQCAVHGPASQLARGGAGRAGCLEHEFDLVVELVGPVVTLLVQRGLDGLLDVGNAGPVDVRDVDLFAAVAQVDEVDGAGEAPVAAAEVATMRQSGQPTHALFDNRAFAIESDPLALGTQSGGSGRSVVLQQDMPGISRQHCTLQLENGQCIIRDHSRYGTFLNGERVTARQQIGLGDLLRVGSPGRELRAIALRDPEDGHGQ